MLTPQILDSKIQLIRMISCPIQAAEARYYLTQEVLKAIANHADEPATLAFMAIAMDDLDEIEGH